MDPVPPLFHETIHTMQSLEEEQKEQKEKRGGGKEEIWLSSITLYADTNKAVWYTFFSLYSFFTVFTKKKRRKGKMAKLHTSNPVPLSICKFFPEVASDGPVKPFL